MARILIHSIVFVPDGVSTAYLYADLVDELKQLGHHVEVLTSTPHYNKVEEAIERQPLRKKGLFFYQSQFKGVNILHIPMSKSKITAKRIFDFVRFHIQALLSLFYLKPFDIVLAPSPPLTIGIVGIWLAKLRGAKAIYNVQEIYPDFAINQGVIKNGLVIKVLKSLERYIYNKSAAVVTIDKVFSELIRPRFKHPEKLHIIPNFVDTELYKPAQRHNAFSKKHGLDDRFVVAYAGNIGYAQDWEPLIFAAEQLKAYPITFLIIGDGVRKKWLGEQISLLGLTNILLLDYQPREMMPSINAAADAHTILMSADMDNDGFPSKIYTILASAKPAIVATGKGSPLFNLLQKANYNRIVPLNDKKAYAETVLSAYNERTLLPTEGENGRIFIEKNYSKQAISLQYHHLIEQLVQKASPL